MSVTTGDLTSRLQAALGRLGATSSDYDLNPDVVLPAHRKLRKAAVLVPILPWDKGQVLLTKRSSRLKHHPGQIAFPGGKQDEGDFDLTATALREAQEEVGLSPQNVDVLGQMPGHETTSGFIVAPILGLVQRPFEPVGEVGEVDEIFTAPISHVLNTARYSVQSREWLGRKRKYYTVPFGSYYIWGATARMLYALAAADTL